VNPTNKRKRSESQSCLCVCLFAFFPSLAVATGCTRHRRKRAIRRVSDASPPRARSIRRHLSLSTPSSPSVRNQGKFSSCYRRGEGTTTRIAPITPIQSTRAITNACCVQPTTPLGYGTGVRGHRTQVPISTFHVILRRWTPAPCRVPSPFFQACQRESLSEIGLRTDIHTYIHTYVAAAYVFSRRRVSCDDQTDGCGGLGRTDGGASIDWSTGTAKRLRCFHALLHTPKRRKKRKNRRGFPNRPCVSKPACVCVIFFKSQPPIISSESRPEHDDDDD